MPKQCQQLDSWYSSEFSSGGCVLWGVFFLNLYQCYEWSIVFQWLRAWKILKIQTYFVILNIWIKSFSFYQFLISFSDPTPLLKMDFKFRNGRQGIYRLIQSDTEMGFGTWTGRTTTSWSTNFWILRFVTIGFRFFCGYGLRCRENK